MTVLHEPVRDTARADWIAGVAEKLALREGRHDTARDMEIMRWCREAATRFADARIQAFVPVLVERIVGDRIRRDRIGRGCAPAVMERAGR